MRPCDRWNLSKSPSLRTSGKRYSSQETYQFLVLRRCWCAQGTNSLILKLFPELVNRRLQNVISSVQFCSVALLDVRPIDRGSPRSASTEAALRMEDEHMRILLYNPDNGVTRNFMPHLWMFLLQSLTPPGHEVLLIDGNAQPMDEAGIAQFRARQNIGLVGIGAMTRMIAKAYRMADAIRAVGVPVVMGGPHVTEVPDEALGRDGGPRHADAVALGEADETWPQIVDDAARGELKDIYAPVDEFGQERKPSLQDYPAIPWDKIDLDQFNLVPKDGDAHCFSASATAGEPFASSRSSPDAAALTAASSARSPDSSATPSAFAPTKALSTNCCC